MWFPLRKRPVAARLVSLHRVAIHLYEGAATIGRLRYGKLFALRIPTSTVKAHALSCSEPNELSVFRATYSAAANGGSIAACFISNYLSWSLFLSITNNIILYGNLPLFLSKRNLDDK